MLAFKFQLKFVLLLIIIILSASLLAKNNFAQQSNLIENLDVQGNRLLTDEEILKYIKTRPGDKFNEKQTRADLQAILESGFFNKSNTRVVTETGLRGGVNVIFEVQELPLITEVEFDGLRYISKEEILAALSRQKIEINPNDSFQPEKIRTAIEIIKEYLVKKRGFVDAKVCVNEEEVTATTLRIAFMIDEMPDDEDDF